MSQHIVVVGAGIIGAAVSAELAGRGAKVTVLEAERPAGGTSGASFGWLNSREKEPAAYHDLNVSGMDALNRFADTCRTSGWYHDGGGVEWSLDDGAREALTTKVARRQELGYPVTWLTRDELLQLEPDIAGAAVPADGIAYFPTEAWIDVPLLAGILLSRARSNGARVFPNTTVTDFEISGRRIVAVLAGEERLPVDTVVNCAGPRADHVAALAGVELTLKNEVGLVVTTTPIAVAVGRVIHAPSLTLRPDGGGRLLMRSAVADKAVHSQSGSYQVEPDAVRDLLSTTKQLLPGAPDLQAEAVRVGVRPIPPDRLPILGRSDEVDNFHLAVCHSGATLCLKVGELLAAEILADGLPDFGRASAPRQSGAGQ